MHFFAIKSVLSMKKFLSYILLSSLGLLTSLETSHACSRVLHQGATAVLVGRNMDWFRNAKLKMTVFPRGIKRQGGDDAKALKWVSRYGSMAFVVYDDDIPESTSDGINEKGFSVEVNALSETNYGHSSTKATMSQLRWAQFYLDSFANVKEAVAFAKNDTLQLQPFFFKSLENSLGIHLSLADPSGDSAIIEYLDGRVHIYHDKRYKVVTNDPNYHQQLENLSMYTDFGGEKSLPGSFSSSDRFVRGAFYEKQIPRSDDLEEEIYSLLSVMENVSQPERGITKDKPYAARTIWRNVADLTHKTYYFQSRKQRQLIFFSLDGFNLNKNSPILEYYPENHPDHTGNVSTFFKVGKLIPGNTLGHSVK